jgi:hypothetical protein
MTATEHAGTRSARHSTLRDDLLDDLRHAAPMSAVQPTAVQPAADQPTADQPVPVSAERPDATDPETPTLELRVTPRRWSAPSMRLPSSGVGLVVTAGPLRVSLTGVGR